MSDDGADHLDDVELLRRSSRDPESFGELYDRHAAAVMRYCLRRTGSAATAADLTAEVFAAAYLSRRAFVDRGAPVRAWLFGIARNQVGSFHRKERVATRHRRRLGMRIETEWHDDLDRIGHLVGLDDLRPRLDAAVGALPSGQAEAVRLRIVDELTYAEIAELLGCTEGAARVRVSRGLSRMAEEMEATNYAEHAP